MRTHLALLPEGSVDLSKTIVLMKKDLIEFALAREGTMTEAMRQQYKVMKQGLRRLFPIGADSGVLEVATRDDLLIRADALIAEGRKVIILDDGSLTSNLNRADINGTAGEQYCVVSTQDIPMPLESDAPFVNLNAMAMMGVAILHSDTLLFKDAYLSFTGEEAPKTLLEDLARKALWIIRVLPRIVRFSTDEIRRINERSELFDAAA
ncbi:MAG: hypothetical protein A2987_05910 [Omnitrophica bacterium RIFCSPLOWO2_01_FULL_45_10]|nr:MAG: hypothetical protein A2987_05910 [Omnitrophica bacterium RIFCSPLOWO2_01_FULL_45_10]